MPRRRCTAQVRGRRAVTSRPQPGGDPGRPARRRGLAHAGLGQEPDDGLLRREAGRAAGMENPTLVVLTDRNDLDDQLFGTFARCHELLRQTPVQAETARICARSCGSASGGVVFTTIQKFFPEEKGDQHPLLSDRRNIVVIADEAHRSQYDFIDGFARHMRDALPNASFIGFTGTPIEKERQEHAGGLRRLHQHLRHPAGGGGQGHGADLLREPPGQAGAEDARNARRSTRIRGSHRRRRTRAQGKAQDASGRSWKRSSARRNGSQLIAEDFVDAFGAAAGGDGRQGDDRLHEPPHLRGAVQRDHRAAPDWHHDDDDKGVIKIVMTGSASDPLDWQAAHPQQAAARGAGQAVQRTRRPVPDRHRARHVADRLRRAACTRCTWTSPCAATG